MAHKFGMSVEDIHNLLYFSFDKEKPLCHKNSKCLKLMRQLTYDQLVEVVYYRFESYDIQLNKYPLLIRSLIIAVEMDDMEILNFILRINVDLNRLGKFFAPILLSDIYELYKLNSQKLIKALSFLISKGLNINMPLYPSTSLINAYIIDMITVNSDIECHIDHNKYIVNTEYRGFIQTVYYPNYICKVAHMFVDYYKDVVLFLILNNANVNRIDRYKLSAKMILKNTNLIEDCNTSILNDSMLLVDTNTNNIKSSKISGSMVVI